VEHKDPQLERLLAASRPRPRIDFADGLEAELFPARAAKWRVRKPFFAAAGLAGGLAAVALAFGLAGGGPLAGDESVEADQNCHYVTVKQVRRVPTVVTDRAGQPHIRTHKRIVDRRVKRCS
jgi:hypothetical protein